MSQYAVMPLSDYVGSCEVIRHFTGDTAEIKSGDVPDQISLACETALTNGIDQGIKIGRAEGYTEGQQAENDRMWDVFQCDGERDYYEYAFTRTKATHISPKHIVAPTSRLIHTFSNSPLLESIDASKFDFSNISVTAAASTGCLYNTFLNCPKLKILPDCNIPAGGMYSTFSGCVSLETIELVRYNIDCVIVNAYTSCVKLKNIAIEGEIGNNIEFLHSPLSKASTTNVIEHLSKNVSGKTASFNLIAVQSAFETSSGANDGNTSEEWLNLIATKPNWTINLI